ncbi:class I SAM-dependent methyltransferase [Acidiferrimicrobium sp. IK]|uniref:class I SAM-dependent methyltransferase n=1 Tax=Acidiferrimicrobium sp. IK TaxID=2871700 RepID=UPI0021CAF44D|nr:class I SAM-dependent methyltransferase [Acidiferrimicrobium sp. IK]MCU4187381.1 class I SAM-dependent methyltransferase [Acidiferrimicrobium sp. IK]
MPEVLGPRGASARGPERARSFGAVAEDYDRYRPGPPADAVGWVLGPGAADGLDLGAGTGAVSRHLGRTMPGTVVAVEPDGRMRRVLARRAPAARPVAAVGESLPFAAASFDAVVVASAWHWMEPARTVTEVARVLRPGGRFGVLWNGADRSADWVADLLRRPQPDQAGQIDQAGQAGRDGWRRYRSVVLPDGAPFAPPETATFAWSTTMTVEDLVGLASTYSGMITLPDDERAAEMARVRAGALQMIAPASRAVVVPMACQCWRATRL